MSLLYFCGLPQSGKTRLTLSICRYLQDQKLNPLLFKPYETGVRNKQILENFTDAELFQSAFGTSSINLHNLYFYQKSGIVEFLGQEELNPFKMEIYRDYLHKVRKEFSHLLIELSGTLDDPLSEKTEVGDLIIEPDCVFFLISTEETEFRANLALLNKIDKFSNTKIILNNLSPIKNPEWIFYLWNYLQDKKGLQILTMLPFQKSPDEDFSPEILSLLTEGIKKGLGVKVNFRKKPN